MKRLRTLRARVAALEDRAVEGPGRIHVVRDDDPEPEDLPDGTLLVRIRRHIVSDPALLPPGCEVDTGSEILPPYHWRKRRE